MAASGTDALPAPDTVPPGGGSDGHGSTPQLVPTIVANPTFEIAREDCEGGGVIAPPAGTLPPPPWGAVCREVFVQDARTVSRFRSVPIDRARRACLWDDGGGGVGGGAGMRVGREPGTAMITPQLQTCGVFPVDEDAVFLRTWESQDADIYELLLRSHRSEASVVVAVFACQIFLAGLTLPLGLLLLGVPENDSDLLARALKAMQPGLGCVTLVLAEVACLGSFLRVAGSYRHATATSTLGTSGRYGAVTAIGGRRMLWRLLRDALHAVVCGALVIVCLLHGRCNTLLYRDLWDSSIIWPVGFARQLIAAQAVLGLAGLVLALPEARAAIVPSAQPPATGVLDRGGRQSGTGSGGRLTKC